MISSYLTVLNNGFPLDQGSLRVDILDGRDIPAVDRTGECLHFAPSENRIVKRFLQAHQILTS